MLKLLHFADAHIDMANFGRLDPESGLPMRVMDFLRSLDEIVETALREQVDLVIFSGDAYKDRNPAPTYQREWGRRMMKLSQAGIATLLLVGNHDLTPSLGRAHALEEFNTLDIANIWVCSRPTLYTPEHLNGLQVQILALPWVTRSGMVAYLDMDLSNKDQINEELEERLTQTIQAWLKDCDPQLPTILAAHASIQGALYGGERAVMLGGDLVLSPALVKNPRFDYVALGHIHKAQDLNEGKHPPVIYPGSIERVDFGEVKDKKYFVIAEVDKAKTIYAFRELRHIRKFIDCALTLENSDFVTEQVRKTLPTPKEMADAIVRLVLRYPKAFEAMIDDAAIRDMAAEAFEFRFVKQASVETRIRIPEDKAVSSLSALELLDIYWRSNQNDDPDDPDLIELAKTIIEKTLQKP